MMKNLLTIRTLLMLLCLLAGCTADKTQMLQQLETLEQQNRADSVMTNDSLALTLANWFDRHGTPNEQLRAYYILGRTYADLGETPRAIEAYNKAAECADTTAANCDYKTLSRVHAQQAGIFRNQYLPQEAVEAFDKAIEFAQAVGDTLAVLNFQENQIGAFYQLGRYDKVLSSTEIVLQGYQDHGLYEYAANSLGSSIFVLLQRHKISKAKQYIDFYERYADMNNDPAYREAALYTYKGSYLLSVGRPDSAVYYFRMQLRYKERLNNRVQAYHGLYSAYCLLNKKDSAMRYADLYCMANDSSNIFESADCLQRLQSIYRYERTQRIADLNNERAERNKMLIWLSLALSSIVLFIVVQYFRRARADEKRRIVSLNKEYNDLREAYYKAKEDLSLVEEENTVLISRKEREIEEYKKLISQYEGEFSISGSSVSSFNDNPLLKRLHKNASVGLTITDDDLNGLFDFVGETCPNFFTSIYTLSGSLSHKQKSLCALTKAYFIPSEIASLLNMRYQSVTNMRSRLAKKLFGIDSTTQDFDLKIHSIL